MMEAPRPLTRHRIYSTSDGRAGIDPARIFSSKPTRTSVQTEIGAASGDRGNHPSPSPIAKRGGGVASDPSGPPTGGRSSMLEHLIGLIGSDGATRLVAAFGGTRIYIPQSPAPEDTLSEAIGYQSARALAHIYAGDRIEVPNPPPRRVRILELRANGLSIDAIARSLGCTRRRVFQVMAEARAVPPAR